SAPAQCRRFCFTPRFQYLTTNEQGGLRAELQRTESAELRLSGRRGVCVQCGSARGRAGEPAICAAELLGVSGERASDSLADNIWNGSDKRVSGAADGDGGR